MPISYTVKQGDTLNGIASSYGYKDYKDAGVSSVSSGNFDKINVGDSITIPNYNPSKVSTLPGATTLFTTTHGLSGGLANYTYLFNFTIYANGATNIQNSDLGMMSNNASVAGVIGANTATEDSTASKNIIITAQNSVSDANFAATLRNVVIKKIS